MEGRSVNMMLNVHRNHTAYSGRAGGRNVVILFIPQLLVILIMIYYYNNNAENLKRTYRCPWNHWAIPIEYKTYVHQVKDS